MHVLYLTDKGTYDRFPVYVILIGARYKLRSAVTHNGVTTVTVVLVGDFQSLVISKI